MSSDLNSIGSLVDGAVDEHILSSFIFLFLGGGGGLLSSNFHISSDYRRVKEREREREREMRKGAKRDGLRWTNTDK